MDKLSEIQLIRGINEKRIPLVQWEKGFTIFPVGNKYDAQANFSLIKPRINVNLATYEEIIEFLDQFDQNTVYFINYSAKNYDDIYAQDYYQKREEIAAELTKLPRTKTREDIKNKLSNITQYDRSQDFFIPYSYWYEIHLKTEIDNVQAEVRAVVSVDRNDGRAKVSKLIIHNFLLR